MPSDVVLNKIEIIEKCIKRIDEEYQDTPDNLKNITKQDSIILNIQRANEACIDLAMHLVALKQLGVPQNSRDAFELLNNAGFINNEITKKMKAMVGFRNIAIHNYQAVNIDLVKNIIEYHLIDLLEFREVILKLGL